MVNSVLRLLCVCLLRFVFVCGLLLWQRVLTGAGFGVCLMVICLLGSGCLRGIATWVFWFSVGLV